MASVNPNLYPVGSDEWLNAKLALIEPQLRKSLEEMAAARGLTGSGIVEKQLADELNKYKQQYISEASDKQFQAEESEKDREAQEKMAKMQSKAAERAALWSGLGQMGGYALLNPKISSKIGSGIKSAVNWANPNNSIENKTVINNPNSILNSNKISTIGKSDMFNTKPEDLSINQIPESVSDQTRSFGGSYGISGLSGLAGYLANPNHNLGTAATAGITSALAGKNLANGGSSWASLAPFIATSLMPTKGNILSTKGNFFKSNLFKTLLGIGSGYLGATI